MFKSKLPKILDKVIAAHSRNILLKRTGARNGLKSKQWLNMIANDNRERFFSTPRCSRIRAWNTQERLNALKN